jgi:tungstate transport system substrate-binding protein
MKLQSLLGLLLVAGCTSKVPESLILATTTSTQDSGLLDVLVPRFRAETGIEVKVIAVGTGQALELGRRGDADVLMVHAPAAEQQFMAEGFGSSRRALMHNDFVLVGPPTDPAGVKGSTAIGDVFTRLARREALFVSRGDESGTHQKERAIWKQAGLEPHGEWYISAGAGMAHVLRMADQKRAYALGDRGTFLALSRGLDLVILSEGDPVLQNPYHVIIVSPEKHAHVRYQAAQRFVEFLVSEPVQRMIADFGKDQFGQSLFFPDAAQVETIP